MSSQPIASSSGVAETPEGCRRCGALLAEDQRYCLECGERRVPMSSVLLEGSPVPPGREPADRAPAPLQRPQSEYDRGPGNAVVLLAAVGVLLLAIGVGVLIGRSVSSGGTAGSPAVVTVSTVPSTGSAPTDATSAFADDWPAGTSGYTVKLQYLPQSGTAVSAVQAAKTAAGAKGAREVGALKSDDFAGLGSGSYVIYSGVYHARAQATKALARLKKTFPGASVIKVSGESSRSSGTSSSGVAAGGSGAGAGSAHPAPPSAGHHKSGQSYEQESRNLPDVISTG